MVVWQGWGSLGGIIPAAIYLLNRLIFDAAFGKNYSDNHAWVSGVSFLLSGVILVVLGFKLRDPGREVIDARTGQRVLLRKKHTFCFIPLEYEGIALLVIGVCRFFV